MSTIHATEKPLLKVFNNDFVFSIPAYQRPYAWTEEQASELLSDLLSFSNSSDSTTDTNPYFLGSIVLIKSETAPEADVVDGQQRLTTLTILLAVLQTLVSRTHASRITKYIYQEVDPFEGKDTCYRLNLREKDRDFFRKYIQDEGNLTSLFSLNYSKLTDSQRNIQANARYFSEELKKIDEQQLEKFVRYLMTSCFLVVVSTPDFDSAYRIFSTLNSRGLELSPTDILKSDIIGAIRESQQEKYTKIWEDKEANLGREIFQELFSHIRMIYTKTKLREKILKEFRKFIKPEENPEEFIDDVVQPYSDALDVIKNANYLSSDEDAKSVNSMFRWLNRIDNFDWIPPAILYLSRNDNNLNNLKQFFTDLERLAAGLMILRTDINDRIGRYAKLLGAIEASSDLYANDSPLQLTSAEKVAIIKTLDGDLYLMKRIRLYVLLRLDSTLFDGEAIYNYKIITIEHILPQNPSAESTWLQLFPTEDERNSYVHRLGNLALLSNKMNPAAQNFDFVQKKNVFQNLRFDKKKNTYVKANIGIVPFSLTIQALQESEWTPEVINKRQVSLLESLKKIWRL